MQTYKGSYLTTIDGELLLTDLLEPEVIYSQFVMVVTARMTGYFSSAEQLHFSNFINTALACSPLERTSDELLVGIEVVSNSDYDTDHPAGSDLSKLIDVVVLEDINEFNQLKIDLSEFLENKSTIPFEIALLLKSPPDVSQEFEFIVNYHIDGIDQDFFELKTDPIRLRIE